MTNPERILNLQKLGYTEREAAFLNLAALHSGYFLRRQYLAFLRRQSGKLDERFLQRAIAAKHLNTVSFRSDRVIYHTASKPLFRALGEENNRNRRIHEIPSVKTRIMALDYVLQQPEQHFLATETERVSFFASLGIEKYMPKRRYRSARSAAFTDRHFVDKFPIAWSESEGNPLVSFVFVDAGTSTAGFELYLEQYRELLRRTPACRIVYVSPFRDKHHHSRTLFVRTVTPGRDTIPATLLAHFEDRAAYERKDFSRFDQAKLIEYREQLSRFTSPKYEPLFERWKHGESGETPQSADTNIEFSTHVLSFSYEMFGGTKTQQVGECARNPTDSPTYSPSDSPSCGSYVSGD